MPQIVEVTPTYARLVLSTLRREYGFVTDQEVFVHVLKKTDVWASWEEAQRDHAAFLKSKKSRLPEYIDNDYLIGVTFK